jgi:hypothetical protein
MDYVWLVRFNNCIELVSLSFTSALENLNNSLSRLTHNSTLPNVILTGDFNLPDIVWDKDDIKGGYTIKSSPNLELYFIPRYFAVSV